MKLSPVWSLLVLLFAAPVVHAQTAPAAKPAEAAAGEEKPTGAITGMPIARADGRWFGLTMEGPKLKLNFYDDHKMPEKADRVRAVLRVDPVTRKEERDAMNPSPDGTALVANKPVRAPWVFKVYITLINADESAAETLVLDFNRDDADAATAKAQAEYQSVMQTLAKEKAAGGKPPADSAETGASSAAPQAPAAPKSKVY